MSPSSGVDAGLPLTQAGVAVALARQRLLAASFDYYKLKAKSKGIVGCFINKRVPHITLRSIAQNTALDPIFRKT